VSQLTVTPCTPWVPIGCQTIPTSTAAISGSFLQAAQEVLYAKTGRQFDECEQTFRPCRRDCFGSAWPWSTSWNEWGTEWPHPYLYAGQWFNLGCGGCPGTCSCSVLHEVLLPYPVSEVTNITIDGVALDPLDDHVILYDYKHLVRIDGSDWPLCNDLSLPAGQSGTWTITVTTGTPVPKLGQLALGELFNEFLKACTTGECALPPNVTNIVRQGVSITTLDPNEVFADGKLGLYLCDLFISTYNPQGISDRARAIDVDARGPRYQTWP
jgi:hypothetical protein